MLNIQFKGIISPRSGKYSSKWKWTIPVLILTSFFLFNWNIFRILLPPTGVQTLGICLLLKPTVIREGRQRRSVSCHFEEGNGRLARLCKLSRDLATLGLCTAACHDEQIGQVWSPCGAALAWGGVYEARNNDTRVGTLWKSCWATEPKPPKPFDGACGWGPNLATRELQPSKATLESQGPALSQNDLTICVKKMKKIAGTPCIELVGWCVSTRVAHKNSLSGRGTKKHFLCCRSQRVKQRSTRALTLVLFFLLLVCSPSTSGPLTLC